jgi:predicted AlkP superfamily phosphohydrolase/phosphomutase
MPRVLLIAWDGADWRILDPLLESGALPNLAALIERGGRAVLDSVVPIHSWSAWPSFLTGADPADHGVFDILESREGTRRQFPVSFRSIRERTFLADLTAAEVETVMVNVPLTFPPPRIHGKLIAGGVLPRGRPFTYPEELPDELRQAGAPFPINGMSWTTYRNRPEPFLEEVVEMTKARQRSLEHLLDTTDWRVACAVFVATDRVQHCLAKYVSNDHPDYASLSKEPVAEKVRDVYRLLDGGLGRTLERTTPDDLVLFVSDHGFHACTHAVHMDRLLAHLGLLDFSASNAVFGPMQWGPMRSLARKVYDRLGLHGKVPLPHSVNWSTTTAYTSVRTTGEGVSINLAGREPEGIVDPADHERVRDEVAEQLLGFVDPATGRHPIVGIRRREQVFKGKFAEEAPDLLLEADPLYSLTHARNAVEPADWLSGDHRLDGVLAAAGATVDPSAFAGRTFNLVDLAPTILAAAGASSSVRHSGAVLDPLVGKPAATTVIPGMAAEPGDGEAGFKMGEEEAEEVEEHLRGLGYLE